MQAEPTCPADACVLLDANNLMHRYYHARPTTISAGRNVNAARGLGELVGRLRRDFRPHSIVAVFDAGRSRREELLPGYKGHRDATPPDLAFQLELAARDLPRRYGADTLRVPPYEADDVIASLAQAVRGGGRPVVVVSSDKDLAHLVTDADPRVLMYARGTDAWRFSDEAAVALRFGVRPQAMLDWLALCGDTTDSIPGVPGIGPKTAASLLAKYGTLEGVLDSASAGDAGEGRKPATSERPRLRELLSTHRDAAKLSRRLVAPVPVPLAEAGRLLRTTTTTQLPLGGT